MWPEGRKWPREMQTLRPRRAEPQGRQAESAWVQAPSVQAMQV